MLTDSDRQDLLASLIRPEYRDVPRKPHRIAIAKGGEGLGNRLLGFLEAVVYSVVSGRELIVDWRDGIYAPRGENAFSLLFSSPFAASGAVLEDDRSVSPVAWSGILDVPYAEAAERCGLSEDYDNWRQVRQRLSIDPARLDYLTDVVVMYNLHFRFSKFSRYLELSKPEGGSMDKLEMLRALRRGSLAVDPSIQAEIDSFRAQHFVSPMIGIHVRQTDNMLHPRKAVSFEAYLPIIASRLSARPDARIFLSTDNSRIEDEMRERFQTVISKPKFFHLNQAPLHGPGGDADRRRGGREALIDMCLLAACDEIVCSGKSSFAKLSMLFSDMDPTFYHDVDAIAS